MAKKKKYYIVSAEIMESNFPDEFADKTYPGRSILPVESEHSLKSLKEQIGMSNPEPLFTLSSKK